MTMVIATALDLADVGKQLGVQCRRIPRRAPLRSKLQALLMLLYSESGDVDLAALEAKLQALLQLPDSVLALLIQHPDLADLNEMLDAVFLGTSDLSGVNAELDKIDVTSVPGPSEKIDVVKVSGKPTYIVHSPAVQEGTDTAAGSLVSTRWTGDGDGGIPG